MIGMQNQDDARFFNVHSKKVGKCEHSFVVSNWVKTEKSQNASQFVCQKCLSLVSMESITMQHAKFLEIALRQNPET